MADVKIEVKGAFINGKAPGTTVTVTDKEAEHLVAVGYATKVKEEPKPKAKSTPKKATEKKTSEEKE